MRKKVKSMVVFIDTDFDLKLKQYMLNLEKKNIHKTKASLLVELAMERLTVLI
jgi:hypothetical protein